MINFKDIETKVLVAAHNACAAMLGSTPVNKFKDRATAERRTAFLLSQVNPEKRPAPFNEPLPGGAKQLDAMKGDVRAKDAPHPMIKSITSTSGPAIQPRDAVDPDLSMARKAMGKEPLPPTKDATPTPPVADKAARWRKPKTTQPSKVAYRPRAGSLQDRMYKLLTQIGPQGERGVTVEEFCADMEAAGAAPTMLKHEQTWSNLGYLFVSQKGYGLEFDGMRIWLLVPKDERDAAAAKKGG